MRVLQVKGSKHLIGHLSILANIKNAIVRKTSKPHSSESLSLRNYLKSRDSRHRKRHRARTPVR